MAVDLLPYEECARSLSRRRVSAAVLFRGERDRVLLVEPTYRPDWILPGGTVEADERPWTVACREVREELGLDRPLGALLAVDHVRAAGVMPGGSRSSGTAAGSPRPTWAG